MVITKDHIKKFKTFSAKGFTQGAGKPFPGECCIEVAISQALGLPATDNPSCVLLDVAEIKIFLNDQMPFKDNFERAKLLEPVGIAQLGSNSLDPKEFKKRFFLKEREFLVPIFFDLIKEKNRVPEHEELKQFWIKNWRDKEKIKEKFKPYYNYYYYYNYYNYYHYNSTVFRDCIIKILLDTLIEMKSPGCKFLPKPKKKRGLVK